MRIAAPPQTPQLPPIAGPRVTSPPRPARPPRLACRPAGLLLLTVLCGFSIYTSYLLAALHEAPNGERLNTYREMGEAILGERVGERMGRSGRAAGRAGGGRGEW